MKTKKRCKSVNPDYDMSKLDEFTLAYLEAALWSTNDESTPEGGEPFDANYDFENFHPDTLALMVADCKDFQDKYGDIIEGHESQAGHDFWLTRCGHGSGFWDRPEIWGEQSTLLTDASTSYGESYLELGGDGFIYCT